MSDPTQANAIADSARAIAILPSIARNIWFYPAVGDGRHEDGQPFAAIIAGVNDDGTINLLVAARDGSPYGAQHVRLVQEGEPIDLEAAHAVWMPYQRGQAVKTDQLGGDVAGRLQAVEKLLETDGTVHKLITGMARDVGAQLGAVNERVAAIELATKGETTPPKEPPPQATIDAQTAADRNLQPDASQQS